jgi:hypothetical protein
LDEPAAPGADEAELDEQKTMVLEPAEPRQDAEALEHDAEALEHDAE